MEMKRRKERLSRDIWLEYFNRVLLERAVISEETHRKMKIRIRESEQ